MNAQLHLHPATGAYAAVESVKLLVSRDAWPMVADALRTATRGAGVTWKAQRSAAWVVLEEGSVAAHACRVALGEAGVPVIETLPNAPQCEGCGCVAELACEGGCGWAGVNRCTRCAGSKAGPRRRANGALMSRRMSRMGRP